MANVTFTIAWVAAPDADINTYYRVDLDHTGLWTTQQAGQQATLNPGGGVYTPPTVTAEQNVTEYEKTIVLPAGSNTLFPANSLIRWGDEFIMLGSVVSAGSDTYSNCIRGVGASIPVAHATSSVITGVHEDLSVGALEIGGKHLVRHRVYRIQGSDLSRPSEGLSIFPSKRVDSAHTVIWGIYEDGDGNPVAGAEITVVTSGQGYIGQSSEHIMPSTRTYHTDSDGYFEFNAVVTAKVTGTYSISLTMGSAPARTLANIPDREYCNFEECI